MTGVPPGRTHGKAATYSIGCRCDLCRAAFAKYKREWRRRRGGRSWAEHVASLTRTHGTPSTYNTGCRCDDCRRAAREARARHRAKTRERSGMARPRRERAPRVTTAIRFTPEVHEALRETADELGVGMNWLVNKFVEQGLESMDLSAFRLTRSGS